MASIISSLRTRTLSPNVMQCSLIDYIKEIFTAIVKSIPSSAKIFSVIFDIGIYSNVRCCGAHHN